MAPRKLETNPFGEIRYSDDAGVGIRYRVELTRAPPVGAPPTEQTSYLQLPPGSERIVRLAEQLAPEGAGGRVAFQLVRELRRRYRYSLRLSGDARNSGEATPLERFLFSRKTGTCEHFATALTLLLRARGIPARLVTGFAGAEWNPVGGFYSVRQRFAHSWTEAFLGGEWVTLDATPAASEPTTAATPSIVSLIVDTLRMRWHRHVVGYDLATQGEIAIALWRYWRRSTVRRPGLPQISWIAPLAVALLALAGVIAIRWRRRRQRPTTAPHRPPKMRLSQKAATKLITRLDRRLSSLGYPRPPTRTPREHVEAIGRIAPGLAQELGEVVDRYNQVRFGKVAFQEGETRNLAGRIRRLGRGGALTN